MVGGETPHRVRPGLEAGINSSHGFKGATCNTGFDSRYEVLMKVLRTILVVAAATLIPSAPALDLINNGSFESGTNGWLLVGGAARYQVTSTNFQGTQALRVFNRPNFTNAPAQDVLANLLTSSNGTAWTTRLAVQVAFPTTIRAQLRLVADVGGTLVTNRHLLAERVLRSSNQWFIVSGTKTVAWTGTLVEATFYTESGMRQETPSTSAFPATIFDLVSVRPDADGDGLWDDEEKPIALGGYGTLPDNRDSDGDGIPDGWEVANGTDPLVADAGADPDHDLATNWQEYWAATSPTNALSYPGRARTNSLTENANAVLAYLAKLPANRTNQTSGTNRVIAAQHVTDIEPEWSTQVMGLAAVSGKWPGIVSFAADGGPTGVLQMDIIVPRALEVWTNGGIPLIKWAMSSPWTALGAGSTNGVDIPELLNPSPTLLTNQTARSNYLVWRDNMASNLTILRDAGVAVLFRPCSEMNGTWFWWGNKPRDQYLALWRDLHDYLTLTRGLTNLLWVYESDSTVHLVAGAATSSGTPIDYYYPGDEYVDVVGHNFYDDDWTLTYDSDMVMRRYDKVFAVPQAGPGTNRGGAFNNFTYLNGASNTIPRISFFCVWNSFTNFSGVITSHIGIVDNLNASNLMAHPLVVTRDEVNWQYELPQRIAVARTNGNLLRVDWQGGVLQESASLGSWNDVTAPTRPHLCDPILVPARFWRVRK